MKTSLNILLKKITHSSAEAPFSSSLRLRPLFFSFSDVPDGWICDPVDDDDDDGEEIDEGKEADAAVGETHTDFLQSEEVWDSTFLILPGPSSFDFDLVNWML